MEKKDYTNRNLDDIIKQDKKIKKFRDRNPVHEKRSHKF